MPVEKTDVLDFITDDPKTKIVSLVMVESRDWRHTPEAVQQIHDKLNTYAQFLLTDSLAQQYPDLAKNHICIRLEHFSPMVPEVGAALREWAGKLSGVPVKVVSHRMYWNRLISFFQLLKEKFRGHGRYTIEWVPESGADEALLTASSFTQEVIAAFFKALPDSEIKVEKDLHLKVIGPDGEALDAFLDNAYAQYRGNPENKESVLDRYAKVYVEVVEQKRQKPQKERVVPIIKDKGWLEDAKHVIAAKSAGKPMESVYEVYNDELVVMYAEDTPRNVRYLTPNVLKELGLEVKELRNLACENLGRILPTPDIQMQGGVTRIKAGGDYDASLLLIDSFWDDAKLDVAGEIVVAIPARDFLVATGSKDEGGLAMLKVLAEKVSSQAPYRLTSKLFVRRGGTFQVFEG